MKEAFDLIRKRIKEVKSYGYCSECGHRTICDKVEKECGGEDLCGATMRDIALSIVSEVEAEYGNDVCEWKNEKGMFIQNPHTGRKFSNEPSMKNVYCNTCGKKIKVVE